MAEHEIKEKRGTFRKIAKISALSLLVLTISSIVFVLCYLAGIKEWQTFDPAVIARDMQRSTFLYDKNGEQFAALSGSERRYYVALEDIPEYVRGAFLAVEDSRFYEHNGIDIIRILGALVEDIKSGSIKQGASTISQQLIKHSTLVFDQDISRKLTEIMMAFKLEDMYSKDEILELYLNQIYFGAGAYGVETAAQTYFSKPASELTLSEGALLCGIVKSPSKYAPHLHMDNALKRRDLVLEQMLKNEIITQEEYDSAVSETITLHMNTDEDYPYGYYTDMVLKEATTQLGISYTELMTGGYRIYTNLDPTMQTQLEETAEDDSLFPENASDGLQAECAVVTLDAKTGQICAILGGREHTARLSLNRATSMRRQPGSAIKPVMVYAPAMEYAGYSTTSFLLDQPENFDGYSPRNSGNNYRGWVTLRDCVAYSINVPAVKLLNEISVARAKSYASSVGIPFDSKDKNLSLALGGFTTGVTPLELCASYLPFANGGYYEEPSSLSRIVNAQGEEVYKNTAEKYSVLSPETSFLMSSMLSSSVEYGTSKNLKLENVPLSAKTGTSIYDDANNNKDAWIVAYNPEYVVCCWMGFDKTDSLHYLPKGVTGGTYPAALTKSFFSKIYAEKSAPSFSAPVGVLSAKLDKEALTEQCEVKLAGEYTPSDNIVTEYFTRENMPQEEPEYTLLTPPKDFSVTLGSQEPILEFTSEEGVPYLLSRQDGGQGAPVEIARITGTGGKVQYNDYTAAPEEQYIYRVTPLPNESESATDAIPSAQYIYSPKKD